MKGLPHIGGLERSKLLFQCFLSWMNLNNAPEIVLTLVASGLEGTTRLLMAKIEELEILDRILNGFRLMMEESVTRS
jgi:hypothetical protein